MTAADRNAGDRSMVRVHGWIIVFVTLVTVGLAAGVVLTQPVEHAAEAELELLNAPTRGAPIPPDMGTERRVALSGSIARDAASRMETDVETARAGLSVSVVTDTDVLVIHYRANSAETAQSGAEAFTQSYVAARNARQKQRTVEVITQPQALPATTPTSAPLLLAAGLLAGLGLGAAAAFGWDRVSDRVRSSGELVRSRMEVLATGLVLPERDEGWRHGRVAAGNFGYLAGLLTARTEHRRDAVRVLVTSPRQTEDRAAAAIATAVSLAELGRHVVLVDADGYRVEGQRAAISKLTQGPATPGFAEVISGQCSADAALRHSSVEGLRVITSSVPRSTAPLEIDSLTLMLGELATRNIVVVAGPPLLESPDAWLLADHVDVVLVVADLRRLRRRDAALAVDMLSSVGAAVVGWVTTTRPHRVRRRPGGRGESPSLERPSATGSGRQPRVSGTTRP